jgi:hypothetical protein
MKKYQAVTFIVILLLFLLFLAATVWDASMSAMQTSQQPIARSTGRQAAQTGADEAARVARDPSRVILKIAARSEADLLAARRLGVVIEDYGSMLVVAATPEAARQATQSSSLDLAPLETTIQLRGFNFDPLIEDPGRAYQATGGYRESAADEGDYYLVQFVAPARDEWLDELRVAGGQVLQYVPNQAFFVYASSGAIAAISRHPRVRWVGAFHPVYKLAPELRERIYGDQPQRSDRSGNTEEPIAYDVAVFKQADLDSLSGRLAALAANIRNRIVLPNNYFNVLQVEVDLAQLKQISQLQGVVAIDPYYQPKREDERAAQVISGNFSSVTSLNPPGYNSLAQFGVDGTNVTVAVADDGVGIPGDGGFYITTANAVNGPLRGATAGAEGHGHLNATIIAGDTPFSALDPLGYNYGLGIARKAHIVNIPMLRPGYTGTAADIVNDAVTTAGPNGVVSFISNNSWGSGLNGNAYDSFAAQYDGFARDASSAATIDPLLVVFSAGNSGQSGLTRPKASKNTIAVANAENIRTELSASANNIDDLNASSSRGPAADGRIKPDISAPGTAISGGRSGPDVLFGDIDAAHRWSSGTSHAAPQVAGAAALFTQFWKNNNGGINPSPAIVKAALINGVQEMNGFGTTDPIPNRDEGWGRLNLQNVLNTGTPIKYVNQANALSNIGDAVIFTGTVAAGSRHFRTTLVWTDPPGVSDPALVNNLDLEVVVGGTLYKGNVFSNGQSITGGAADIRNNVENVFLPAGIPAGTQVSIRVRASALNGDGVLGNADFTDQHFALVAFNLNESPVAAVAGVASSLTTEGCLPANSAIDPGETVTVNFSLQNLGSLNAANVTATLQASGGVSSPSGSQSYGTLVANGAAVSRPFTFTANGDCNGVLTATLNLQDGAANLGTAVFKFALGAVSGASSTYSYNGPPVAIPDGNAGGVNVPLMVNGFSGRIADLNFRIDGTTCNATAGSTTAGVDHSFVGDLTFRLTSPAGTTVTFINRPGGVSNGGNNFCQVLLDDDASATSIAAIIPTGLPPAGPPYTGTFKPQGPFSAFDGQDPNGVWTLNVSDAVAPDSGNVRAFSLIITSYACCTGTCPTITVNPSNPVLQSGSVGTPYNQTFTALGGAAPHTFSVSAGTLPPGLSLTAGGVLSGAPVQNGNFTFTVMATDANGCMGTREYTLSIGGSCSILPTTLAVDDGSFEASFGFAAGPLTAHYVNRLTPGSYPATLNHVSVYFPAATGMTVGASVNIIVGTNLDGDANIDGSISQTVVGTIQALNQFNTYSVAPVTINSGDFVVGFSFNIPATGAFPAATDTAPPQQGRSYLSTNGTTFTIAGSAGSPRSTGIRAIVSAGGCCPSATTLAVDDGTAEETLGYPSTVPTSLFVNRLTPASYPATLTSVLVNINRPVGTNISIVVGANPDGDANINGSITQTISATLSASNTFVNYQAAPVTITSGDFVVGFRYTPVTGTFPANLDETPPSQVRSYASSDGTTFASLDSLGFPGNLLIRANVCGSGLGSSGLQYYPLPFPVRLLDTRPGAQACFAPGAPLGNNVVRFQPAVGACSGIPAAARAVVGNATVVNFTSTGFHWITLFPSGAPQPNASNLNFSDNQIVPNAFTVGLGTDGAFNIYSHAAADFIVDITGYYAPPGAGGLYFHPLPAPLRLLDTRAGGAACDAPNLPLATNGTRTVTAHRSCQGATIPAAARAIVGNATVVNFISSGFNYITLYPFGTSQPNASNLNYTANQIIPNAVTVGLSSDGRFNIFSSGATDFIVDVAGYFSDQAVDVNGQGLLFSTLPTPLRLLDTRPGALGCDAPGTPLGNDATRTQLAHRSCSGVTIPATARAVVGNGTVVNFISSGFHWITLYPFGAAQPNASNLNFTLNQIVPNAFVVGLSNDGRFNIYSHGSTHFIVDLTGYFAP